MFPFHQGGELSFQTSDNAEDQQDQNNNMEDLIIGTSAGGVSGRGRGPGRARGRGRGRRSSTLAVTGNATNEDYERRVMHREVERQRRQEMSSLYSSLRSILPAEYIKGKRSMSDHVAQAANYIKDLEKNVKELGERRDQLRTCEGSSSSRDEAGRSSNFMPGNVEIFPIADGLKVDISVSCEDEGFLLSTALQVVYEEGLNVASYTSTRINESLILHSLLCEVSNVTCIDVNRLQQRLMDLVC